MDGRRFCQASGAAPQAASFLQMSANTRFSLSSRTENAVLDALGVLGEQPLDELAARGGQRTIAARRSCGSRKRRTRPRRLERRDDLGRVGLRGPQARAQVAQLELAAGGRQDDQDLEARGADAFALEVGRQAAADGRLGAQQRLERAVGERITGHEAHCARIMPPADRTR